MRLWKRARDITLTEFLRLGKDAVIKVFNSDNTVSTITGAELKQLDGSFRAETLTAAKTLVAADSGKTFYLGLAGGFTVTLPAPAAGLHFRFVISVSPTTAYIIVTNGGADIMIGGVNELEVDTSNDGPYDANADTLNLVANTAVVGDYINMESDGTSWYFNGQTNADGGVTTSTT